MNMLARLYNRGPHLDCYRGMVRLHDDGRMTWADSGLDVQIYHGDYLQEIALDRRHSAVAG